MKHLLLETRHWLVVLASLVFGLSLPHCAKKDVVSLQNGETYIETELRAQTGNSINTDSKDEEDYVHNVAMYVFPSGSAKRVGFFYSADRDQLKRPKAVARVGANDIYFIVNIFTSKSDAEKITERGEIERLLAELKPFTGEANQKATTSGFPMARVYYNQDISGQGSTSHPYQWMPLVAETKPLMPVSEYGNALELGRQQSAVGLVRSIAKISIRIQGDGLNDIKKIEYVNAVDKYSLRQIDRGAVPASSSRIAFDVTDIKTAHNSFDTKVYVPECLFSESAPPGWNPIPDLPTGATNYIEITTIAGKMFRVPVAIVSDDKENYLKIVKGQKTTSIAPNYDVVRNNHYSFTVGIPRDAREIEVSAQVMPWNLVASEKDFDKDISSLEIDFPEGGGSGQLHSDGKTIILKGNAKALLKFKLTGPKGAVWRATVTNGLDFGVTLNKDATKETLSAIGKSADAYGIASSGVYEIYVLPLKTHMGAHRETEFYISVDGDEILLLKDLPPGTEPGPGKRYVIRQEA